MSSPYLRLVLQINRSLVPPPASFFTVPVPVLEVELECGVSQFLCFIIMTGTEENGWHLVEESGVSYILYIYMNTHTYTHLMVSQTWPVRQQKEFEGFVGGHHPCC